MKLLFDQNISFRILRKIATHYPDSKHVSDCGLMNCEDHEIWDYAKANAYSIVTFDSDFFDISLINGQPPKIIWIRAGNLSTDQLEELLINRRIEIIDFLEDTDKLDEACLEIG